LEAGYLFTTLQYSITPLIQDRKTEGIYLPLEYLAHIALLP